MAEPMGFNNRILRVSLNDGTLKSEEIGTDILRKYIGGTSLGCYYLLKEIKEKIDPLGPENRIYFTTSPLTGVRFSGNARHSVSCISPLTGGLASSEAGGWWGSSLKLAGLDAVAVEGVSPHPVYLYIEDGKYELKDASDLWGKTTGDVQILLKERHGKTARVLQTGPAGENLVRYACVTNELRHFNGRGGIGAVMGYKKIRAIVVKNIRKSIPTADPEGIKEYARYLNSDIKNHPALGPHGELGTTRFLMPTNAGGMLPTRNFQDGCFEAAEDVSGEEIARLYGDGSHTCFACTVHCKRKMKRMDDSPVDTSLYGGPEYESMSTLGPLLGVTDPGDVVKLNALCNAMGLDTISTGVVISWLMEAFEKEPERLEGYEKICWNDTEKIETLIMEICSRKEGLPRLLAGGCRAAAETIGGSTMDYAIQVKGQEFPAHEPRGKWNVGLGMAVNAAGADHLVVAHDVVIDHEGDPAPRFGGADLTDLEPIGLTEPLPSESLSPRKIRNFVYLQQLWTVHDILDLCKFTSIPETRSYTLRHIVELLEMATGWKSSLFDLMKCAERSHNMARLINLRMGIGADQDTLPERMFEEIKKGAIKGHKIDREEFRKALKLYYEMMNWNEQGIPRHGKLVELGIEEFSA